MCSGSERKDFCCNSEIGPVSLLMREIQQGHIRTLLRSFEDNFTAIWGNVEVANVEVRGEVGQLPLGTRVQID